MALDLFDTHVHLDAEEYNADREEILTRARNAGVTRFVTIGAGYGAESAKRAIVLAESHTDVWASVGIHPHDASTPLEPETLRALALHPRVVAIGETGFDFHYDLAPRAAQEAWFRSQIELALELKKPLVIHCRKAAPECLALLIEMHAGDVGGVFHCYSETAEFARKLRDINFLISIPGMVTFKKADEVRKTIGEIPLDQIMLETDGPFLAPVPYRGKRCESAFMVETARCVAEIKGIPLEELARVTTATALRFFKL